VRGCQALQCAGGCGVGGEEGFHRQFLQGHVHRRAKNGGGADEVQHAGRGAQAQRHHHARVFAVQGAGAFGAIRYRVVLQLREQGNECGVAGGGDLLAQALEEVVAPLGQIGDA